jgi:hypothetical protein
MRDVRECIASISAWPDGRVAPQLLFWLQDIGLANNQIRPHFSPNTRDARDLIEEYNWGVKYVCLESNARWFIIADNDIKPDLRTTAPFLELETDIACVEYPTEPPHEAAWGSTVAFHCALWMCRREVLEQMERPWFRPLFSDDGCKQQVCICPDFAERAMQQGFTGSHAGWADHTPRKRC